MTGTIVEYTQPISYQSYFMKGEYWSTNMGGEIENPRLTFSIYYQLQIESSR